MSMPVNSIVQCTYVWSYGGQVFLNVLHYRVATAGEGSIADELDQMNTILADDSDPTAFAGAFLAVAPDNAFLTAVRSQQIVPARSAYREHSILASPGQLDSAPTGNDGAVIVKRTDVSGDNQKGAVRLVALPADTAEEGNLLDAYRDLLEVSFTWLAGEVTLPTSETVLRSCIYHKDTANGSDITNILVPRTVRITRRRTVGLGI